MDLLPIFRPAEEEKPAGCHDGVGPAGGRGVMQGVGGDSSVSHCTQGVTSPGWVRVRERDGETGPRVRDFQRFSVLEN